MSINIEAEVNRAKFADWVEENKEAILEYLMLEEEELLIKLYNRYSKVKGGLK